MAGSDSSSSGAEPPPSKFEIKTIAINIRIPRRKLTLIAVTFLLNVLLWSSIICLAASIYQVASDPKDVTNITPVVLTSTSALATISYTFLHTIFSFKQRIWKHQHRHPSAIKKTSYVAIRIVVSLCVFWLLTSGWNMIIVARRPICLIEAPGLQGWEYGPTCQIGRVGIAFAMIALVASCTLLGVLAAVRRPFEAHLFKHGYEPPADPCPLPFVPRRSSPVRPASYAMEDPFRDRHQSMSTHRSAPSIFSNTDGDTLDLNTSRPSSTIYSPSPVRSLGLGIFTSDFTPPPIPAAYVAPPRTYSLETPPPVFQPSVSHHSLSRPPRLSGHVSTSGFVPLSIPLQYSASTWRAVHPSSPSLMRPVSRSHPHLSSAGFSHRNRYSRSSLSLTRPHRLSSVTPVDSVAWSSRSGSTGPEGQGSSTSGEDKADRRASASEIAYAIQNGTPIPGTTRPKDRKATHMRTVSAPDTTSAAQQPQQLDRMAMGWKPQLRSQNADQRPSIEETNLPETESVPTKIVRLVQSRSANFLSRFSPDTSPESDEKRPRQALERELDARKISRKSLPILRSKSVDSMRHSETTTGAANPAEAAATMLSNMPKDILLHKSRTLSAGAESQKKMQFEDVKNKPLPKITMV